MNLRHNPTLTEEFLNCCKEVGLSTVAIYTTTPLLKESEYWKKDNWYRLCVLGNDVRYNHSLAIWTAVNKFQMTHPKIKHSCGNSNQMQVAPNILKKGVYQLKDGIWERS